MMMTRRYAVYSVSLLLLVTSCADAAKEKPATPAPPKEESVAEMFVDCAKLEVVDLLRSGALIVGFGAAFFADKKGEARNFMLANSIFTGLYGLAHFFFPALVLGYQTVGTLDSIHVFGLQALGCILVGAAVTLHRQYHANSKDVQVTGAWLLSNVIGSLAMMIAQFYSQQSLKKAPQRFNDQHITFTMLATFLIFAGCLVKAWVILGNGGSGRVSTRGRSATNNLNQHLLIHLVVVFPAAMLMLISPEFTMDYFLGVKADGIHSHIVRSTACFHVSMCVMIMLALQFDSDSDRRDIFMGFFVAMCMVFPLMFLTQYKHQVYSTKQFGVTLGINIPLFLNVVCACFIRNKEKQY